MRKITERVTLEVTYDADMYDPAAEWDWTALTDLVDPVTVVTAGA